jgi:hypothetical protein
MWTKPEHCRYLKQQSYLLTKGESKILERMAGRFFKRLDWRNFVDEPFTYYQQYLKRPGLNHTLSEKPKFFP